jgi:RNA polymerase sigma-70 factor (ECF subfamily)
MRLFGKQGEVMLGALPVAARPADADADLLDLVDAGRLDDALRLVMRRHGDAIYRYCLGQLHDGALAEDVQQQVFIHAHRDFRRFARRSSLKTWLFGIAHHRILDARRRRRPEQPLDDVLAETLSDGGRAADQRIDDILLVQALGECLGALGEHVRSALLLHYQQGFSFEEMADITHEKAGTLQARVARALPVLKACIQRRTGGSL